MVINPNAVKMDSTLCIDVGIARKPTHGIAGVLALTDVLTCDNRNQVESLRKMGVCGFEVSRHKQ